MSARHRKDRKTQIEWTLRAMTKPGVDSDQAWRRLCTELETICHPEARPPRFKNLLDAIWRAATNEC